MTIDHTPPTALKGAEYIREFARKLPSSAGVYRMLGEKGNVLYVGKAKDLKKRVMSYATKGALPTRTLRMISQTLAMEVITTRSEAEALLVEANLIKELKPVYNILYRDDKSYPYILLSTGHAFPQLQKHRGAQKEKGKYYGPFASVGALNQTLDILQKAFLLRNCSDSTFASRTRPCLQYQIKRCSAPCVGYIDESGYAGLVKDADDFLKGRSRAVQDKMITEMQDLSERQEYEKAAIIRNRIRVLTQVQQEQDFGFGTLEEADVIALARREGHTCIQLFFYRGGQAYGNRSFFPTGTADRGEAEIIESFIGQYYGEHPSPKHLVLSHAPENKELLEEALSLRKEQKVTIHSPQRGDKKEALEQVIRNTEQRLALHLAEREHGDKMLSEVCQLFELPGIPKRIEVYDNSHLSGTHAVGAMIVAGQEGFDKKSYRRFTIRSEELTPGDDYGMMREMLTRRFARLRKEYPAREEGVWPDLLLIDGGAGQLSAALEALKDCGMDDQKVVGIAKGPDRNAGKETFFLPGKEPFQLPPASPVLHYLQRLRNEAHRFAISSHRIKRANAIRTSELDQIGGIGALRKRALLHHFGSSKAVQTASLEELSKVPGISGKVARQIYDFFHPAG